MFVQFAITWKINNVTSMKKKLVTKILTGFRLDPRLKLLAVAASEIENRSLSNYIENLIRKDVETKGLIEPVTALSKK